jgi:pimeloyl-ACP methyl ester carboxylesterase
MTLEDGLESWVPTITLRRRFVRASYKDLENTMRFALISTLTTFAILTVGMIAWLYTPDKPRAALEAKYAPRPSQFLVDDGVRVHVRDSGPTAAPAVILLHGFGSSLHTWEEWAQLLDADYRVVRFDLPGFGLTGPDPTEDYTDHRSIDILIDLMDQLGISRASIIGHSMGGRIAWKFAALHPTRVDKLSLIAPDGFASRGHAYGRETRGAFDSATPSLFSADGAHARFAATGLWQSSRYD